MNSTKRAIQTTFIDLYRKKSYDQMNVKELCVQTPVARTTFYEYYDNLGTLKAEIEDELIGGILKIAKATAGGSFVEMNLNVFFAQTLDYFGSTTVKVVVPLSLFADTAPPCNSHTFFTTARPMPFPSDECDSSA